MLAAMPVTDTFMATLEVADPTEAVALTPVTSTFTPASMTVSYTHLTLPTIYSV